MTERGAEVLPIPPFEGKRGRASAYPIEVLGMLTKRGNAPREVLPIRGQASSKERAPVDNY